MAFTMTKDGVTAETELLGQRFKVTPETRNASILAFSG